MHSVGIVKARLVLASLAVLAVAGCSSSSSGGDAGPTTPPTLASDSTSPSASASVTPTTSPSPTITPTFPTTIKATHGCTLPDLEMTIGQGQGAAGSTILPIVFTNTSNRPCTLYGYPGVSFLDASEQPLGVPAARSGGEEGVVTVAPGAAANAQLQVPDPGNFSSAGCNAATSTFIKVYPPGETHFIEEEEKIQICTTQAGATSVQPVTPGSGG